MLYIFHGPDDFTRNEKIAELRAAVGDPSLVDLNVTVLEGRELRLGDIRHHADAMPFMTDKRLVIVNNYVGQVANNSEELAQLVEYLGNLSPTTDLVLTENESLRRGNAVLKAAAAVDGVVTHFAGPEKNNLRPWIIKKARYIIYQSRKTSGN